MPPPTLRSARLRLRPLTILDAEPLRALIDDFEVARWLAKVPHPYTLDDAVAFLGHVADTDPLVWGIDDGALCGVIGLEDELGYWLARAHWGKGYVTEAGHRVLRWHFGDGGGDITSGHFLGNDRSGRVLHKLGFTPTDIRQRHSRAQGRDVASQEMRLTRAGWTAASRTA